MKSKVKTIFIGAVDQFDFELQLFANEKNNLLG